ncbi:MAG TPA: tetratricopeptide repeat protein [Pyrinomonadaceae bacterium]|nr:tetratricopeptide repeat protein [Pyrinomonadaceae bacterium]
MPWKTKVLIVILLITASVAHAQSVSDPIRAAVEQGNWPTVVSEIAKVRASNPNSLQSKNYDYLFARASEKTGDVAGAAGAYQSVVARNTQLAEYALWHLSRMARATGDLTQEREHLRRLVASAPTSLLYDAAVLRLAESLFESGDFTAAATSARLGITFKNVPNARQSQLLLGQSLARSGKTAEARDVFSKILMQMPDASRPDDFALQATRELDQMERTAGSPQLSEADRLLRASVYQFNRDFAGARLHYEAIVQQNPQSPAVPNALYQLGRGFYLETKYPEAINYFQRVADQFPQNQSARDALGFLGSTYVRMKRTDDAVAAYKAIIDRFKDGPNLERPYLNIIDALHEAGRYKEALDWTQQTRTLFKNDIGGNLALFAKLRIDLSQNAWADVFQDITDLQHSSDLGGTRVPGGTTEAEVAFLRAYTKEQLGDLDAAVTAYLGIPDGRSEYYGTRASLRLLKLATTERTRAAMETKQKPMLAAIKNAMEQPDFDRARVAAHAVLRVTTDPTTRNEILTKLRDIYAQLPSYQLRTFRIVSLIKEEPTDNNSHRALANQLLALGLYDEGLPEFLAARTTAVPVAGGNPTSTASPKSGPTLTDEDYTVAVYSLQAGQPNRAVRFAEQYWRTVPADYVLELAPRQMVELLYPVPYRESLLKHTPSRNVDPRFVLSIARQESRFQADAKSVAAARGMMQFIAATASEVAAQLKHSNFSQDDLYEPDTAILFGSQYLSSLFQQFPNQPEAVAASYNGGADNMTRWMGRSRSKEPERYVPEIGFSQSKDYVYRVMSNFWTYQRLYDGQLQPTSR